MEQNTIIMDRTKQSATAYICNAVIMLESLEDLKDSKLYSKQVKYYGNKFVEEFSKIASYSTRSI